jgi:hypothetical protein
VTARASPAAPPAHIQAWFRRAGGLHAGSLSWPPPNVTVPGEPCAELAAASALVTYGWGMIPVTVRLTVGA